MNDSARIMLSRESPQAYATPVCPACGAATRRVEARFCATCGRRLDDGYLPADSIRASYHLQHDQSQAPVVKAEANPRLSQSAPNMLFTKHRNSAAAIALAFATYALVPYLGILFCPGAIVIGGVGLLHARRASYKGGARAAFFSIVIGLLILCIQIFLWWLLYKVPQWAQL